MKRLLLTAVLLALPGSGLAEALATPAPAAKPAPAPAPVKYGANKAAGRTFVHDGVRLYYEVYGGGRAPAAGARQRRQHQRHGRPDRALPQALSRDRDGQPRSGKSADSPDTLTYEKMTDDLAALLDHLKVAPVDVLGWSDGGIEALLLGIRHPAKVKKIAAMAANLNPSAAALRPEVLAADQVDDR